MTKEQIQKEILEMDSYIPVCKIEERLNMPPTTLQKVLSGKRELPKKWFKVLEGYFNKKEEQKSEEFKELTPEEFDNLGWKEKIEYRNKLKNKIK